MPAKFICPSERLAAASVAAGILARGCSLAVADNGIRVTWDGYSHKAGWVPISRIWQTAGQDYYPTWYQLFPYGGTTTTALSQLVRWCQGKPVLPLPTWRYWTGPRILLARDRGGELMHGLEVAGYPQATPCVLCGRELTGGLDWWSMRKQKLTGPCCLFSEGCKQHYKLLKKGRS